MAPTILVVGATGNTGRGVVDTLPKLLQDSTDFKNSRILALTRSKTSEVSQRIANLPGVELVEQNWVEINAEWLRKHHVDRIFIASHNAPNQFAEEGQFFVESLRAGVEYVVRISTTAANVHPDYPAYYPRTHWAIEAMLSQPEFKKMKWTSLQPNVFFNFILPPAAAFIQEHRKTGKQGTLSLMLDRDAPVGVIDGPEIGVVAAHLLAQKDTSQYNQKKLVLNGPEDLTGEQVVQMVESYIGDKVKDVKYKDVSFVEQWADGEKVQSKNVIRSITHAPVTGWTGECSAATTSKEVLDLAPPRRRASEILKEMLEAA